MTPDEMRAKARELFDDASARLKEAGLGANVDSQIAITVDQVSAMTLGIVADAIESLSPDVKADKAKKILESLEAQKSQFAAKNDAIRKAAAKGFKSNDWSEFDRLVDESAPDDGAEG